VTAFTAVFDACVLYPAPLRDMLMELAVADLFRARWTDEIHDEWIRNVLKNRTDLTADKLQKTREAMNRAVKDGLVTEYGDLISGLKLPDQKDRHVLAAAIKCGAAVIVTINLKDFPASYLEKYGIEPQHPDEFISCQFDLNKPVACSAIKRLRHRLTKPPKSVSEYIDTMAKLSLPQTVNRLKSFEDLL
jgi:predicted nucleic acid-binding protein